MSATVPALYPMGSLAPPFVVAMVVPTGIGAAIGGFAGDATPAMNLLASVSDVLITHPNVANAAVFQKLPTNALYVEGYGLDCFLRGAVALRPVRKNRVGVILDAGIPADMQVLHVNTMNAVQSVYGIDLVGYVQTENPIQVGCEITESGCSSGYLRNPQVILSAARQLQRQGATAIALCTLLPELEEQETERESAYRAGGGVDPIGGIEGILSHLLVSELGIPCANAPVFTWEKACPVTDEVLDPRTAAEFIAPTFLPCVLTGLARAPQMVEPSWVQPGDVERQHLAAVVAPVDALGGLPVLAALEQEVPVLAVASNPTVLGVDAQCFAAAPECRRNLIRVVHSYEEAAGVLQSMRLGLQLQPTAVKACSLLLNHSH